MLYRATANLYQVTALHELKSTRSYYSYSYYFSGFCLHNIGILSIKTNGNGTQSIGYQIDPQKVNLHLFTITDKFLTSFIKVNSADNTITKLMR